MSPLHFLLSTLIASFQLMLLAPAHAQHTSGASIASCPGAIAAVVGANPSDLMNVCAGVAASLGFLANHGVNPTEPVSIEVTTRMPQEAGPTAAGCCIEKRRRVYILPYKEFRKNKTWFKLPINPGLYRALAAHEAAHAVGACNFKVPNPTIQAKEYLAYVTMLSVMPDELRIQVLRNTKTQGFESLDRFTPLLYSFDPMRFGAEACRHFSQIQDQTSHIHDVLSGKVLRD